ncbi:MAG: hypothetical protein U0X73_14805 [Thermoanaerobaculia bacterium]
MRAARRAQRRHRLLVGTVTLAGGVALVLAILQLGAGAIARLATGEPDPDIERRMLELWPAEAALALLAGVAVLLGSGISRTHHRWLAARLAAERIHASRFAFLVDPRAWSGARDAADLAREADRIAAEPAGHALEAWGRAVALPLLPELTPEEIRSLGRAELTELCAHYDAHRLRDQIDYFSRRGEGLTIRDALTRRFAPTFFLLSVGAALLHGAIDAGERFAGAEPRAAAAAWLAGALLAAALLPAIGAAVRNLRGAWEFRRNALRYAAVAQGLSKLQGRIESEVAAGADAARIFRDLALAESLLEGESREWLRLMIEAEWWG